MNKKLQVLITVVFIVVVSLIIYLSSTQNVSFSMTNVSTRLKANIPANYSGALLVNLDDDKENELFISVISDKNIFFKRQGKFLVPLHIPELEDAEVQTFSVTACDLTGDGRDEILLINSGSLQSKIMTYQQQKWVPLPIKPEVQKHLSGAYSATCIDRRGNNVFGLAVVSSVGPHHYLEWQNNVVQDISADIGFNLTSDARSVIGVPGPLGRTNIFVTNSSSNLYFVNRGDGTYEEKAIEYGIAGKEFEGRGASLIDLNHDENIDIVYGNHLGPLFIYEQMNTGHFKNVTPDVLASNYAVNSVVVADFNFDGYEDVYLNNIRNKNGLFLRDKDEWSEVDLGENDEKEFYGVSSVVADFDKDGSLELLNTHGDGKKFPLTLYSVKAESRFFSVRPLLPNGGIPRGAVVKFKTSERTVIRAVSTGSGRFANYDNVISIGLFKDETVIEVEVIKSSGEKVVRNQNLNQGGVVEISL